MEISENDRNDLLNSKECKNEIFMGIITNIINKYYNVFFSDSDIDILTNGSKCKKEFNLTTSKGKQLSLYIEQDPHLSFAEQMSKLGVETNVYNSSKPRIINGKTYYSTSQLFDDNNGKSKKKVWEWVCNKVGISVSNFTYEMIKYYFSYRISRRFITSLIAKPFVILTGNSGTGKTRIAKQFAEYLEVKVKDKNKNWLKNWLIVPVGADWTDNTKIMGYYNPLAGDGGKYEKTKILELIERANDNKNIPYFLILDEMNLSHVERYFSDFLSHMEIPDTPFDIDGYGELKYPDNLFVVGTVNIDETTYMFSPKVLDRANVIEFKPKMEDVLGIFDRDIKTDIKPAGEDMAAAFLLLAKSVRNDKISFDINAYINSQIQDKSEKDKEDKDNKKNIVNPSAIFEDVYGILEKQGFEFAFRTVKEIRHYICAANEFVIDKDKNFITNIIDEQLLQKILPKIHGNKKEIGEMLEELREKCLEYGLKLSGEKIEQMEGKLANSQYASFI